jgi:Domain of unknown function (DUF4347)
MITIRQPALALNSRDFFGGSHYRLIYNRVVDHSRDMTWIKEQILHYLAGHDHLQALIINAHGWCDDGIHIGTGLNRASLPILNANNALTGKIRDIYLCGCAVADTLGGADFCKQLAIQLNANVIASENNQVLTISDQSDLGLIPFMQIDEFEGTVWRWTPPSGAKIPFATPLSPHIPSGRRITARSPQCVY